MKDRTVLTLLLWLAFASPLAAQPFPDGPEFQVNMLTESFQAAPSAASDAAGNFVVAWVGAYRDSSFSGIGARRFDSAGDPLGDEFQVNTWTTGLQGAPVVAMDGTGRFVVVWTDPNRDGDVLSVVARVFDADAMPIGDDFQVNVYTTGRQSRPAVAMGSAGDFVVVWQSDAQDGDREGIFGRHFDSTGAGLGDEFQISDVTTGSQYDPTVSSDGAGSFVVVWTALYPLQGGGYVNGLYGKLIGAGGLDLTGEFQVDTPQGGPLGDPDVAMSGGGGFVVVWSGNSDGSGPSIQARRFDDSATPLEMEFQVNTYTTGNQLAPRIGLDGAGGFVVVWENGGQDSPGYGRGVFARRFDGAGMPLEGEIQVNTYTTDSQFDPDVAVSPEGDFVVVWTDEYLDGSFEGIFGRVFFGDVTCSLGDPDGDDVCENLDNCAGLYNPGQEDSDMDGAGDLCDVAITSPAPMEDLDCSNPATSRPTMSWTPGQYDQFKVFMGSNAGFEKRTFVSSGDTWIKTTSWTPSKKKWRAACRKAIEADPLSPVLFIRALGKDRDVPKRDPARTTFSDTVQADVID